MIFHDNVIKEYLKNVYFISGTPCGGKTTVSREIGKKYGIRVYDIDEMFPVHRKMSDSSSQPSMNRQFRDADEFFGRSVEEYLGWLKGNAREQLDFILLDLIRLSQHERVICDCHIDLEQAKQLSDLSRVAFLIREPSDLVDEYCNRPDHRDFSDFIHSATDFDKAKRVCSETLYALNIRFYEAVKNSSYFWLERDGTRSAEETVRLVAEHFGFDRFENMKLVKVEKDTELAQRLLRFVEDCSWEDAREHIAQLIRSWQFTDWEAIFAAVSGDEIVGMTSVMKTDYYPLPEIYPWISSVFVSEAYRGHRLSEKLISFAERYLAGLGFEKSYIPSEHTGLYERYGYRCVGDIVNYGGGTDHLFVKELK